MKYIISIFIVILCCAPCYAQSYRGTVIDSAGNTPLPMATISVLEARDSSLLAYSISDKNGAFVIRNLPISTNLKAIITYTGYKTYRKIFSIKPNDSFDNGKIRLATSSKELAEVVISSEIPPVVIRNDTIEFNASAFKTRTNALVEELLKKLPGMEIDNEGLITFNGKKVTKVLVNSRDFFSGDPRIATRNLNAEYVEKIQVMDDREDDPNRLKSNVKVERILNLTLKKKYRTGIFGKIYGAIGNKNRYEAGALINTFRDTLQVSIIAATNNSNQSAFSFNELRLLGILERGGFDNVKTIGNGLSFNGVSLGGTGDGLQQVSTAGFNLNYDWGKISKLNLQYFFTAVDNNIISQKFREQFLSDTTLLTQYDNKQQQTTAAHTVSGIYRWTPNAVTTLKYSPSLSFNHGTTTINNHQLSAYNTINDMINSSFSEQNQHSNYFKYQHKLSLYRKFTEKRKTINIIQTVNINPTSGVLFADITENFYNPTLATNAYKQQRSETVNSNYYDIDATLRLPFTKKTTFYFNTVLSHNSKKQAVYTYRQSPTDGKYNIYLSDQSNLLQRNELANKSKLGISINLTDDVQFEVDLNSQLYFLNNRFLANEHLNQKFLFVTPGLNFSTEDFSIKYGMNVIQPDISYLQPVSNTSTPLFVFRGNPNLKPTQSHAIYFDYYKFSNSNNRVYYGNLSAELYKNGLTVRRLITADGVENNYPINQNGSYSLNYSFSTSKTFKKKSGLQYTLNTGMNGSSSRNTIIINEYTGSQYSNTIGFREHIYLAYRTLFSITPSYGIDYTVNNYKKLPYNNVNYYTHIASSTFNLNWPGKISWDIDYNYLYNTRQASQFQKSANLLNASISLLVLPKDVGQIKVSVNDILNQNINYQVISYQNYVDIIQTNLLKRYFMVKLLYNFRK